MRTEATARAMMRKTSEAFYPLPKRERRGSLMMTREPLSPSAPLPPVGTFEMVPFLHDGRDHYIAREVVTGGHISAFMEATNHDLPAPDFALGRWLARYGSRANMQDVQPADQLSMHYVEAYSDWYNSYIDQTHCRVGLPSLEQLNFVYSHRPEGFVPSPLGELTSDMRGDFGVLRHPDGRTGLALTDEPYDPETYTFRLIGQFTPVPEL